MAGKSIIQVGYAWGPRPNNSPSMIKYGTSVTVTVLDKNNQRVDLEFNENGYIFIDGNSYSALEVIDSDNKSISEIIKKDIEYNQKLKSLYYGWGLFPEQRQGSSTTSTASTTSTSGTGRFVTVLYNQGESEPEDEPVSDVETVVRHTERSYRNVNIETWNEPVVYNETGDAYYSYMKFGEIVEYIRDNGFDKLPLTQLMGKITDKLIDAPYVGGTLEIIPETPSCNLSGLDCVTFFENTLAIARAIKNNSFRNGLNPDTLFPKVISEITKTRYRNGNASDYTSRLHYTCEWIIDNVKKGTVEDLTRSLGGVDFKLNLNFMSTHPNSYPALKQDRSLVSKIRSIEQNLNNITSHSYIPKNNIRNIENKLQMGDIIAIATNKTGLDYSHTGLIYKNQNGQSLFMHASSTKQRVIRDVIISNFVNQMSSNLGIAVLRPKE